jgi:hypothetical protein
LLKKTYSSNSLDLLHTFDIHCYLDLRYTTPG